jgi:hypothetical protein
MKKIALVLLIVLSYHSVQAQFIKEKSISAGIGYGASYSYSDDYISGSSGFFAQGELVLKSTSWLSFRPYVGFMITNSKALLLGGKTRLCLPIPYVAPYVEIGAGGSIGNFVFEKKLVTQDFPFYYYIEESQTKVTYHIPFSMGLELGKNHDVDFGLLYYYQPEVKQDFYAFALKLVFPLNKKN